MKKGISLLMLSTIVIVMLVISTSIVIASVNAIDSSKKIKFANELFYLKDMIDSYSDNNQGELPVSESIVLDLKNVSTNSLTQFENEIITNNTIILYKVDKEKLGKMDLRYGNQKDNNINDTYALSKDTGKLYYLQGVNASGQTYYTLNSELEALIQYDKINSAFNRDGIIFIPSTTAWTNHDISIKVMVPSAYNVLEVTVKDSNNNIVASLSYITENDYFVYTGENIGANCYVEVKYQKSIQDTGTLRQVYLVDNVDKTPISINDLKVVELINKDNKTSNRSISFELSEDFSGLKSIKYETENVPEKIAKSYFKTSGILLQNNTVVINADAANFTLYIEDNAGNISLQNLEFETASGNVKPGIPVDKNTEYTTVNSDGGTDTAIIPEGFYVSTDKDEQTIETGLVVVAPDGSEFVWVPVPENELGLFAEPDGTKDESGRNNMRGKLYEFTKDGTPTGTLIEYSATGYREPDIVEDYDNDINNLNQINEILGINLTTGANLKALMQREYNDIYESVKEYHGFYIGRYETGDLSKGKVVSKRGNEDIGNQTWYTMYAKQKKYASQLNGTKIKSNMIYGSQWDATMRWFAKSKDRNVATYPVNAQNGVNANFSGDIKPTGSVGSVNNIYDMAGNVFDWSAEAISTGYRLYRGYYYGTDSSIWYAGYRDNYTPTTSYNYYGSRMSLYIPVSNIEVEKTYIKNGLILHLDGINNSGEGHSAITSIWKDLSGNGNDGKVIGASWINNGLSFDGIDDYVPIAELNYNQFTLEAVFEPKDIPNNEVYQYIITNLEIGGYGIGVSNNNPKGLFGISYNANLKEYEMLFSQNDINLNVKNTLTYTNDGKQHKLYLNGNLINSNIDENRVLGFPTNNTVMALGTNPNGSDNIGLESFKGYIYSARMYDRVLTENEIKNNYNIDKSRFGI